MVSYSRRTDNKPLNIVEMFSKQLYNVVSWQGGILIQEKSKVGKLKILLSASGIDNGAELKSFSVCPVKLDLALALVVIVKNFTCFRAKYFLVSCCNMVGDF